MDDASLGEEKRRGYIRILVPGPLQDLRYWQLAECVSLLVLSRPSHHVPSGQRDRGGCVVRRMHKVSEDIVLLAACCFCRLSSSSGQLSHFWSPSGAFWLDLGGRRARRTRSAPTLASSLETVRVHTRNPPHSAPLSPSLTTSPSTQPYPPMPTHHLQAAQT